jgi:hypothetical protein
MKMSNGEMGAPPATVITEKERTRGDHVCKLVVLIRSLARHVKNARSESGQARQRPVAKSISNGSI